MLNTPWDNGSPLYRILVISAMALTGLGIIVAIIGANVRVQELMLLGMPIIGLGLAAHVAGLVVRARDMKRRQREQRAGHGR